MSGKSLRKEFRDQLRVARKASVKMIKDYRPVTLHSLRSAILRLGFLVKYCSQGKNEGLYRQLMEYRRAMAVCRDYDVCLKRVKDDISVLRSSKTISHKILKQIKRQRSNARADLEMLLTSKRYNKFLLRLEKLREETRDGGLSAIIERERKALGISEWRPEEFHNIRKRLRLMSYFWKFLSIDNNGPNIKRIARYQDLLGNYIDGQNTIKILRSISVKYPQMSYLLQSETRKMSKVRRDIKKTVMLAVFRSEGIASRGNRP